MIEKALVELAEGVVARVYPVLLVQSPELPAVVYQRISTVRDHSHDGPVGLVSARFQFSCWAESYAEAKALAADLRVALDGFKGTVAGTRIDGIFSAGEHDDFDQEPQRFRVIADYVAWWAEEDS